MRYGGGHRNLKAEMRKAQYWVDGDTLVGVVKAYIGPRRYKLLRRTMYWPKQDRPENPHFHRFDVAWRFNLIAERLHRDLSNTGFDLY